MEEKEQRLFEEIADLRARVEKLQDEPKTSCDKN